jgi:hypothetical protein
MLLSIYLERIILLAVIIAAFYPLLTILNVVVILDPIWFRPAAVSVRHGLEKEEKVFKLELTKIHKIPTIKQLIFCDF